MALAAGIAVALLSTVAGRAQGPPAASPKPAAPPKPTAPSYATARQLPARIMEFQAEPASVERGQSAVLQWLAENPVSTTIEPGIGRVTARGSREVKPSATTTYTLTVKGPNDQVLTKTLTVNVAGTEELIDSTAAANLEGAKRETPRTPDGRADLSGVYNFGGVPGGPGWTADLPTQPTLKPGAEKFRVIRGPNDAGATADCMPLVGPRSFGVPYQFQMVQSANDVVILHEYPGIFRLIPTDGTPHQEDPDPAWLGHSVGRWEGDTLVVDTIGFNEKTEVEGFLHTEALHIVERFRRASYNSLEYEAIYEDPNVWTGPWRVTRTFALREDLRTIAEFVCEINPDYKKYFGKDQAEDSKK
jgi:hypothetical protein